MADRSDASASGEPKWTELRYRRGRDVVLAAGQVLAREVGFTRRDLRDPFLLKQILDPKQDSPWAAQLRADLAPFLKDRGPEGRTGYLHLARAIAEDWHAYEASRHGRFKGCPHGAGGALVAMLGAAHLLEGMENAFADMPAFFSLFCPLPSDWVSLVEEITALSRGETPCIAFAVPAVHSGPRIDAVVGLTPFGMTLLGIPPQETAAPLSDQPESSRQETARREAPPRRPPEPSDLPRQILMLETPVLTLADLVLEEEAHLELKFIAALLSEQPGETPVMLFHGPPGTGKTHAARCLAGELGRPLGVASLDQMLIKWHGDTEKAFRQAFTEAAGEGALLLLDEADALLSDRGAMQMSWQISQVNTLLKLLEAPGVPVILCTNFLRVLDGAVHRRVQHLVEFSLPGPDGRMAIWDAELERQGAADAPVCTLDLAELPLTGGLIANAVRQFVRRRAVYGDKFIADTAALLALARKELPKMDREVRPKVIGFSGPGKTTEEALSS